MKYLKIKLFIVLAAILFSDLSCNDKDCHNKITIINNSDKAIYFDLSFIFPDTTLNSNPTFAKSTYKSEKQSIKTHMYRRCLEGDFNYTSRIMCFIYDAQTIEITPWDTVVKKYMILKRYDLSLRNLDSLNWTITYP